MLLKIGAGTGAICVFLAAFAKHAMESKLSLSQLETFQTAIQYMQWHSIAIILIVILKKTNLIKHNKSALLFITGIIFFSGSLFLYLITTFKPLVYITPIGGLLFIIGWITLAFSIKSSK